MAGWIDGDVETPPPELELYLTIRHWGDEGGGGWGDWPAGRLSRLRLVRNVYNAWTSYANAEDRTAWTKKKQNAGANRIVGIVKALRFEDAASVTAVGRWEGWTQLRMTSDE